MKRTAERAVATTRAEIAEVEHGPVGLTRSEIDDDLEEIGRRVEGGLWKRERGSSGSSSKSGREGGGGIGDDDDDDDNETNEESEESNEATNTNNVDSGDGSDGGDDSDGGDINDEDEDEDEDDHTSLSPLRLLRSSARLRSPRSGNGNLCLGGADDNNDGDEVDGASVATGPRRSSRLRVHDEPRHGTGCR